MFTSLAPWDALPLLDERDLDADIDDKRTSLEDIEHLHGTALAQWYSGLLDALQLFLYEGHLGELAGAIATAESREAFVELWNSVPADERQDVQTWLTERHDAEPDDPRHPLVLQLIDEALREPRAAFDGHLERMRALGTGLGEELDDHLNRLRHLSRAARFHELLASAPAALEHAESMGADDAVAEIETLRGRALLHRDAGHRRDDVEAAVASFRRAASLATDDPAEQASRLMNLATAVGERVDGDPRRNLADAEILLRDARALAAGHDSRISATIATNLAVLLGRREGPGGEARANEARALCQEALRYRSPENDVTDWAYTQANLGVTLKQLANEGAASLTDAQAAYEEVLAYEEMVTDRWVVSMTRLNLAAVLDERAATETAEADRERLLRRAIAVLIDAEREATEPILRGRIQWRLAVSQKALGNDVEARDALCRAVAALEPSQAPADCERVALELAHQSADAEDWATAAEAYMTALDAIDLILAAPLGQADREDEIRNRARVHRWASYALVRAGRDDAAAIALENGRTRELRRLLRLEDPALRQVDEIAPDLAVELRDAMTDVRSETDPIAAEAHSSRVQRAVDAIRRLPGLAEFGRGSSVLTIAAAAAVDSPVVFLNPTPNGTVVLAVDHRAAVTSEIWPVTSRDVAVRLFFGTAPEALADSVAPLEDDPDQEFILPDDAVSYVGAAGGITEDQLQDALECVLPWVGEFVCRPLAELLRRMEAREAVLIPCGPLAAAPLVAATWTSGTGPRSLLDDYSITIAPSATAHAAARRRAAKLFDQPCRFAGFADPSGDLPAARGEVATVAARFGAGAAQVLEGNAATRESLVRLAAKATHLHLACHAKGGMLDYQNAGVLLADGPLPLSDVTRLSLSTCRLAVASACETAVQDISDLADESVSLGTALIAAGAASVIASLWAVDDFATALLVTRFYEEVLKPHAEPAKALRHAQLWLRRLNTEEETAYLADHPSLAEHFRRRCESNKPPGRRGRPSGASGTAQPYSDPQYWAAFVCLGA
ncbi:MAG TPA: CHAT domain-containing protein [Solirubrobacteraceae bacterium]